MSDIVVQACPLCAGREYDVLAQFPDGVVVGECRQCGLRYAVKRHSDSSVLFEHSDSGQMERRYAAILAGGARFYRHRIFEYYLELIERHAEGRRLVDVGCGQGFFPALAASCGYTVRAIEPSAAMADFARRNLGLDVQVATIETAELDAQGADVVSFTDSLEYIPDPLAALRRVHGALAPGGIVLVKVPNGEYFAMRQRLQQRFGLGLGDEVPFSPSLRVVHYSREDLARALRQSGFRIEHLDSSPPIHSPRGEDDRAEEEAASGLGAAPLARVVRQAMFRASRVQHRVLSKDSLSQALVAIGRRE